MGTRYHNNSAKKFDFFVVIMCSILMLGFDECPVGCNGDCPCDETTGTNVSQALAYAVSYPDAFPSYVRKYPKKFSGGFSDCAELFASKSKEAALSGPSFQEIDDQTATLAINHGVSLDVAHNAADSMKKQKSDMYAMGQYLDDIAGSLAEIRQGNDMTYKGTSLYLHHSQLWSAMGLFAVQDEIEQMRALMYDLGKWYYSTLAFACCE